jgi:hypothetical protein
MQWSLTTYRAHYFASCVRLLIFLNKSHQGPLNTLQTSNETSQNCLTYPIVDGEISDGAQRKFDKTGTVVSYAPYCFCRFLCKKRMKFRAAGSSKHEAH